MTTAEASRPLRAGMIGAGWIGQQHAEVLASRQDVTLAAVCDLDAERARNAAAASGAAVYADWQQMLDAAELDVLWVCTPPGLHIEPAITAMRRGLPLYLEKP